MAPVDPRPRVLTAQLCDVSDVAALATATWWDTAPAGWLVPDPQHRPGALLGWFTPLVEHAVRYGRVDLLSTRRAAAVWLDRTRPTPAPTDYIQRLSDGCGAHAAAMLRYEALLAQHRPPVGHFHLVILAAIDEQDANLLLAHRHSRTDGLQVPAYAIAASAEQRDLLAAAAYRATAPLGLPDGPALWPMWRPPRLARAVRPRAARATPSALRLGSADLRARR